MRIGILSRSGDRLAKLVRDKVNRLEPRAAQILLTDSVAPVSIDGNRLSWESVALTEMDAAYVRGFRYEDPVVPDSAENKDWSLWQPSYILEQQRYSFYYSVLCRLETAGVKLYNGTSAHLAAFSKFAQLQRLRRRGIRVPAMLCTNDDRAVGRFCDEHREVVWRTSTGRSAWQLFLEKQRKFLIFPSSPPIILAQIAAGPLLRSYVIDGRCVLCLECFAPDCEGLEQFEAFRRVDHADHSEVLRNTAQVTGTRWCQILFVKSDEGPVVYDVDPDPVLTELPEQIGDYLAGALAQALLGRREAEARAKGLGESPIFRRPLFLRRMLRIQFELEDSKYDQTE